MGNAGTYEPVPPGTTRSKQGKSGMKKSRQLAKAKADAKHEEKESKRTEKLETTMENQGVSEEKAEKVAKLMSRKKK